MLSQQDVKCAICFSDAPKNVDHCHTTGSVRGLLCHHCNLLLGHAKDNVGTLANAIEYLKAPKCQKAS